MILTALKQIERRADIPMFLRRFGLNNRICEVGVRFGYHLRQLLACDPTLAIGVDIWKDTGKEGQNDTGMSQRRLDGIYQNVFHEFMFDPRVKLFRGFSVGAASVVDDFSLDFCYLDADHTKTGCWNDLNAWWPKVRRGGMLAGHDYVNTKAKVGVDFGVIEAVADFRKKKKIPDEWFHVTSVDYCSWMIMKLDGE